MPNNAIQQYAFAMIQETIETQTSQLRPRDYREVLEDLRELLVEKLDRIDAEDDLGNEPIEEVEANARNIYSA